MTTEQHPITPPPELVREWREEADNQLSPYYDYIATQAARWGFRQCIKVDAAWLEDKLQKARDQELEACMEWMRSHFHGVPQWADELRAARRPKPPSLAEQGLAALERQVVRSVPSLVATNDCEVIRHALERLQQLEQENND